MGKITWPHFSESELRCRCGCGAIDMDPAFMDMLEGLRVEADFAFHVSSAYRCAEHPVEKIKSGERLGAHRLGRAMDIGLSRGPQRHKLLRIATSTGFLGIGVGDSFIHLDNLDQDWGPRPAVWSY